MSDCVREMTDAEKAKFIMEILKRGGYNMQQWERDYLKSVLQEKIELLLIELVNDVLPSTESSVQHKNDLCDSCINKGKRCYLNEKVACRGYERIYTE